jgi:hypothetical protein
MSSGTPLIQLEAGNYTISITLWLDFIARSIYYSGVKSALARKCVFPWCGKYQSESIVLESGNHGN